MGSWLLETITNLSLEYRADVYANQAIDDPLVIEETKQRLLRMKSQAIKALPGFLGVINYFYTSLLIDPHPPLIFRKGLLNKKLKSF